MCNGNFLICSAGLFLIKGLSLMYLYNCRETFVKPVSLSPREGLETIFLSLCQIFYRNASQWELSTNWPHTLCTPIRPWLNCRFPLGCSCFCHLPPSATTYTAFSVNSMPPLSMYRHISPEYCSTLSILHTVSSFSQTCFVSIFI